jgi:hypothetical protein
MENNPNMVDALFLPRRCVLHSTPIYEHVRENRTMFLHKGSWHKFRGYAYSQLSKIRQQQNELTEFMRLNAVPYDITIDEVEQELVSRTKP